MVKVQLEKVFFWEILVIPKIYSPRILKRSKIFTHCRESVYICVQCLLIVHINEAYDQTRNEHWNVHLRRGRGSFVNIGVTNMWIVELGRIFGKITTFKTFQIRPMELPDSSPSNPYEILLPRNTHHCRLYCAPAAESSILKFQNF